MQGQKNIKFEWMLNSLDRFTRNAPIYNFRKICRVGSELFHVNRQTDKHDEANSRFWQFYERALQYVTQITHMSSKSAQVGTNVAMTLSCIYTCKQYMRRSVSWSPLMCNIANI